MAQIIKPDKVEYKLVAREGNSFHFRMLPNLDFNRSFTVTYAFDGTVTMTGDYGDLVWKRNYFPNGRHDYGFPYEDTNIDYFVEKIIYELQPNIKEFNIEDACNEIMTWFEDGERTDEEIDELNDILQGAEWGEYSNFEVSQHLMYNELCNNFPYAQFEEGEFGVSYTFKFLCQFEALKSVSKIILNEIENDEYWSLL